MDKQTAVDLIQPTREKLINAFPQYVSLITSVPIHLLSEENKLEERNQIATELEATSKNEIVNTAAETIFTSKGIAVIIYYQHLSRKRFIHFLLHEFGHVISIYSSRDLFSEAEEETRTGRMSSLSEGAGVWGELIAETIAYRIENGKANPVPIENVYRLQEELDASVNSGLFNPYSFAFFCAKYFEDPTIVLFRSFNSSNIVGAANCNDGIIPYLEATLQVVSTQLSREDYWRIDRHTLMSLGVCIKNLYDYCFKKLFSDSNDLCDMI